MQNRGLRHHSFLILGMDGVASGEREREREREREGMRIKERRRDDGNEA